MFFAISVFQCGRTHSPRGSLPLLLILLLLAVNDEREAGKKKMLQKKTVFFLHEGTLLSRISNFARRRRLQSVLISLTIQFMSLNFPTF